MKSSIKKSQGFSIINTIIILGLMILVAGTYYYISKKNSFNDSDTIIQLEQPQDSVITAPQQPLIANEQIQETEETSALDAELTPPLPPLNDSDPIALEAIEQLSPSATDTSLLIPQEMIRNFVVFIDNLSKGDIVSYFAPVVRPKQSFSVTRSAQKIYLNTKSYQRYDVYADLIDSIDVSTALTQYRSLKPLIDEAYQEIGYSDKGFLNKLNQSIDLIVDTPIINYPIELIDPSVMYKFADPQLEGLNDLQKLLIRMGPNNTFKMQKKLKQLQQSLQTELP